ncbi:MAG: hypothetical protein HY704_05300 [Gemmatimonadetes bacterium]|nr:hypothetical protein [Gemmatimonadota bacterium]
MAGKLSAGAQMRLEALRQLGDKVQRVHGLVEQFASAKHGHEALAQSIKRAFAQLKLAFMGAGLDQMSQLAGGMAIAAGRGMALQTKTRILRDGVGSLKFQIELEQRAVVAEDQAAQKDAKKGG